MINIAIAPSHSHDYISQGRSYYGSKTKITRKFILLKMGKKEEYKKHRKAKVFSYQIQEGYIPEIGTAVIVMFNSTTPYPASTIYQLIFGPTLGVYHSDETNQIIDGQLSC